MPYFCYDKWCYYITLQNYAISELKNVIIHWNYISLQILIWLKIYKQPVLEIVSAEEWKFYFYSLAVHSPCKLCKKTLLKHPKYMLYTCSDMKSSTALRLKIATLLKYTIQQTLLLQDLSVASVI